MRFAQVLNPASRRGNIRGCRVRREVLGYCDPQLALTEFSRILQQRGLLVCDFGAAESSVQNAGLLWREADIVTDEYNGSSERVWIYHPRFIRRLLRVSGFSVRREYGTHTWSSLATRLGISKTRSTRFSVRWNGCRSRNAGQTFALLLPRKLEFIQDDHEEFPRRVGVFGDAVERGCAKNKRNQEPLTMQCPLRIEQNSDDRHKSWQLWTKHSVEESADSRLILIELGESAAAIIPGVPKWSVSPIFAICCE